MSTPERISRFHGAVLTRLSPELLDWLTRYSPKRGHNRKLMCLKEDGEPFFEESELIAFDAYLKDSWPCEKGERPAIPKGIEREIEVEAFYSCAFCGKSTRESAHIDPVHSSKNNHPHNLICLCPTHHTEYDTGVIEKGEITAKKKALIAARLTLWKLQARGIDSALSAISEVGKRNELPEGIKDLLKAETLEALGRAAAEAPDGEFKKAVTNAIVQKDSILALRAARRQELKRLGEVDCPLCKGSGHQNGMDCPVCDGSGVVDKSSISEIDLHPFQLVDCPLCHGEGEYNGDDCPVCHSDCKIERRYAEQVELKDFELIDCPLCDGEGRHEGDNCPACHGDCQIEHRYAEQVELKDFESVDCPLCDGEGRHEGDDCPACHGDCQIERRYAEQVELKDFESVDCPLCDGEGRHEGDDCPVCHGDCQIERRYAEQVELKDFELVDCPLCDGEGRHEGDDCPACHGDCQMERRYAVHVELSDFE